MDVSTIETSIERFGVTFNSPVLMCPVGSAGAFHPEGEVAVARAARVKNQLQVLSTQTTKSVEDVAKARGGPLWYQLYTTPDFAITTKLVRRAEAAGCPAAAVTVGLPAGGNTVTASRLVICEDPQECTSARSPLPSDRIRTAGRMSACGRR